MPEIVHGLYCEDVRVEEKGKVSLMGVVGKRLIFSVSPPVNLTFSFHCFLWGLVENLEAEVTVGARGLEPMVQRLPVPAETPGFNLNFKVEGMPLSGPTTIATTVRLLLTDPVQRTFELEVEFAPSSTAEAA